MVHDSVLHVDDCMHSAHNMFFVLVLLISPQHGFANTWKTFALKIWHDKNIIMYLIIRRIGPIESQHKYRGALYRYFNIVILHNYVEFQGVRIHFCIRLRWVQCEPCETCGYVPQGYVQARHFTTGGDPNSIDNKKNRGPTIRDGVVCTTRWYESYGASYH